MVERKNSEKRIASNNKWTNAHYDRINLAIPKGRKDIIKSHAEARGQSINSFISEAIDEKLERGAPAPVAASNGADGILTPSTLKTAREAAQAAGETVREFVDRAVDTQAQRDRLTQSIKKASDKKPET